MKMLIMLIKTLVQETLKKQSERSYSFVQLVEIMLLYFALQVALFYITGEKL